MAQIAVKQNTIELVKKHTEYFNKRRLDEAVKEVANEATLVNIPFNLTVTGPTGYREFMQGWIDAFHDAKAEITTSVGGEEWAACEIIGSGTHNGALEGPNGTIAPTGKKVRMNFCEFYRFKSGKLVNYRLYFDWATMKRQLGIN